MRRSWRNGYRNRYQRPEVPTLSKEQIQATIREHVQNVEKHIEDARVLSFPGGFSGGVKGFAEWIAFFSEQARLKHDEETRNDRKTRYNICMKRNTQAVGMVMGMREIPQLVYELNSMGKTNGLIMDFDSIQLLRNEGLGPKNKSEDAL